MALSGALKAPELELASSESKSLATAVGNLLVQFDLTPDPKFEAIAALVMVSASVYGPRVYLINERLKKEKEEKRKPSNISPFPSGGLVNG